MHPDPIRHQSIKIDRSSSIDSTSPADPIDLTNPNPTDLMDLIDLIAPINPMDPTDLGVPINLSDPVRSDPTDVSPFNDMNTSIL